MWMNSHGFNINEANDFHMSISYVLSQSHHIIQSRNSFFDVLLDFMMDARINYYLKYMCVLL